MTKDEITVTSASMGYAVVKLERRHAEVLVVLFTVMAVLIVQLNAPVSFTAQETPMPTSHLVYLPLVVCDDCIRTSTPTPAPPVDPTNTPRPTLTLPGPVLPTVTPRLPTPALP